MILFLCNKWKGLQCNFQSIQYVLAKLFFSQKIESFQQYYLSTWFILFQLSLLNSSDSCHNHQTIYAKCNKRHKKMNARVLYWNCFRSHAKSILTFATCMVVLPDGAKHGFEAVICFWSYFWQNHPVSQSWKLSGGLGHQKKLLVCHLRAIWKESKTVC